MTTTRRHSLAQHICVASFAFVLGACVETLPETTNNGNNSTNNGPGNGTNNGSNNGENNETNNGENNEAECTDATQNEVCVNGPENVVAE